MRAWVAALLVVAGAQVARAEPESAPAESAPGDRLAGAVGTQELGARLGVQVHAGGVATGGLRVGGVYLYRMTSDVWFDGEAAAVFAGGDPVCYLDRNHQTTCAPGVMSGYGFQLAAGVRWFPDVEVRGGFLPYLRGGLALEVDSFASDGVTGYGIPVWASSGGRFRVAERVAIGGDVTLSVGPVFYGHGEGTHALVRLIVAVGVELAL